MLTYRVTKQLGDTDPEFMTPHVPFDQALAVYTALAQRYMHIGWLAHTPATPHTIELTRGGETMTLQIVTNVTARQRIEAQRKRWVNQRAMPTNEQAEAVSDYTVDPDRTPDLFADCLRDGADDYAPETAGV